MQDLEEPPPYNFLCPITQDLMVDPVSLLDGFSYEREAITAWLEEHDTSPSSGLRLDQKLIIPNHGLRGAIDEWNERQASARNASLLAPGDTPFTLRRMQSAARSGIEEAQAQSASGTLLPLMTNPLAAAALLPAAPARRPLMTILQGQAGLKIYRCLRTSSPLEGFHAHLARRTFTQQFIGGVIGQIDHTMKIALRPATGGVSFAPYALQRAEANATMNEDGCICFCAFLQSTTYNDQAAEEAVAAAEEDDEMPVD